MTRIAIPLTASAEEAAVRATVAAIAARYGHDYFVRTAREGGNPSELWKELGGAGLLGVNVAEEYGGGGSGVHELAVVIEELASHGLPLMLLALSPAVCATILGHHGSHEQKQRWLPGLASGETVMAFAITEPEAGSNTHRISTRAVPSATGGWRLRGAKYYVSHLDNAQAILVVARTGEEDARGRAGLSMFVFPLDLPGIRMSPISVEIVSPERQFVIDFEDVELGEDALVGEVDRGLYALFSGLNPERIGSAALLNGIARYALGKAARYAREREVWGVPIGAHQGIAHPLARAHAEVEAARLMTTRSALLFDAGRPEAGSASSIAKHLAAEAAEHALDAAIQAHGGNGMSTEFGLATLSGLVRLFRIAPVSSEMLLNHIAQHELGLPKSY